MGDHVFLECVLEEVSHRRTGVGLHSWNGVVESVDHRGDKIRVEGLLKLLSHVVGDLADAVERSVPDFGVRVLEMGDDDRNHGSNLAGLVDVLTDLRESQDTGILVAPVRLISDRVLHELADQRQHKVVANA